MSMVGRRGLLKTLGLAPLARGGKHKHRETPVGWTNQAFQLLIVNSQAGGFSGAFVYSPGPGNGNLVSSITEEPGTDPYGNDYLGGGYVSYSNDGTDFYAYPFQGDSLSALGVGSFEVFHATSAAGPYSALGGVFVRSNAGGAAQVIVGANAIPATPATAEIQGTLALDEHSATPPTPTGAGLVYVDGTGHLTYKGPGGTVTILAGP